MHQGTLSLKQLFGVLLLSFVALFLISAAAAWTGPTAAPPGNNVDAPINVGTTDQVKNGGVGVDALAVFGDELIQAAGHLNFGATSGDSGYGFRDNAGTMEYKNSGGQWSAFGSGGAPYGIQTFTSSGTWTRPAGVTKVIVYVTGGGGGPGGTGGSNSPYTYVGQTGGTSSFGSYVSAVGGGGGYSYVTACGGGGTDCGGSGGVASGGDINIAGGDGGYGTYDSGNCIGDGCNPTSSGTGGAGGSSYWGGGPTPAGAYGRNGVAFGSGGSGGDAYGTAGGGAGATAVKLIDVSNMPSVAVTVGGGGTSDPAASGVAARSGITGAPGVVVVYEY